MRLPLPNSDYLTDTKSILDQALRVLQAMMDYTAERGWLCSTLRLQNLSQSLIQARWFDEPVFLTLPHVMDNNLDCFYEINRTCENSNPITLPILKDIVCSNYGPIVSLGDNFSEAEIEDIYKIIKALPEITAEICLQPCFGGHQKANLFIDLEKPVFNDIYANKSYIVCVNLFHKAWIVNNGVYCPKYPKPKNEGWFLTLGSQSSNELLAMKRVTLGSQSSTHRLCYQSPQRIGKLILTVYVMSDCYIGIDQQFDVHLNVT